MRNVAPRCQLTKSHFPSAYNQAAKSLLSLWVAAIFRDPTSCKANSLEYLRLRRVAVDRVGQPLERVPSRSASYRNSRVPAGPRTVNPPLPARTALYSKCILSPSRSNRRRINSPTSRSSLVSRFAVELTRSTSLPRRWKAWASSHASGPPRQPAADRFRRGLNRTTQADSSTSTWYAFAGHVKHRSTLLMIGKLGSRPDEVVIGFEKFADRMIPGRADCARIRNIVGAQSEVLLDFPLCFGFHQRAFGGVAIRRKAFTAPTRISIPAVVGVS
jgi:hypothetical protein